jgi:hypothetical protein
MDKLPKRETLRWQHKLRYQRIYSGRCRGRIRQRGSNFRSNYRSSELTCLVVDRVEDSIGKHQRPQGPRADDLSRCELYAYVARDP